MTIKYNARPFIKWAGGKMQLIKQLNVNYPRALQLGQIKNYYEPFLGGGAVFFDVVNRFSIEKFYLSDINEDLMLTYQVIQKKVSTLIELLDVYQQNYLKLAQAQRKIYFYQIREQYNQTRFQVNYQTISEQEIRRAAQLIFLNKTCFNGLFRHNKKGEFNVPFGDYKKPKILDLTNLMSVSQSLQRAILCSADFNALEQYQLGEDSFVYLDPPYRPLTATSSFTTYSKTSFTEEAQIRLADIFRNLDQQGVKLMLSNSDPKNSDKNDDFFEIHYAGFRIQRILAYRMINRIGSQRGKITELLITNY